VRVDVPLSCTVYPMAREAWAELDAAAARIASFVERTRLGGRARFVQLVVDFLKGKDGRWYFLQVRAAFRRWRAAERRHPTGCERMVSFTLQTLHDPKSCCCLGSAFEVAAFPSLTLALTIAGESV
jgi:hypothetical protein